MGEHLVMPSIRGRDVTGAERPNIRCFEHFLQLLNFVDDAFHVHRSQSSGTKQNSVKWHLNLRDTDVWLGRFQPAFSF